jgi:magnesium transporter
MSANHKCVATPITNAQIKPFNKPIATSLFINTLRLEFVILPVAIPPPVVDENNQLIGRITIDDVVDVIRDEAEHSVMSMAGLDEEEDVYLLFCQWQYHG